MSVIDLSEFEMGSSGEYSLRAVDSVDDQYLTFHLPSGYVPSNDLIAIALSTLLGRKYSAVKMDLSISDEAQKKLVHLVNAPVDAKVVGKFMQPPVASGTVLNFSGGFDSLAAKVLMPDDTNLLALDFGGAFDRERLFFEKFEPYIISTNFRQKGFAGNTWAFMGAGSILLRDYLGVDTYSFGSILEAAPFNFAPRLRFSGSADPWMAAVGLRKLSPVQGLTEVGTAMLLNEFVPELIGDSLISLAAPESEKFTRKVILQALAEKAVNRRNRNLLFDVSRSNPHQRFGDVFATDFLSLYILKKGGESMVSWLVEGIPPHIKAAVADLDMSFYERLNTNFYGCLEAGDSQRIYQRCLQAGITPYDQNDWRELGEVTRMLAGYHPMPGFEKPSRPSDLH